MAWVVAQLLLLIIYALLPARGPRVDVPAAEVVAAVFGLLGLGLLAWGGLALGRSLTPDPAPRAGGQLQRRGPYAFLRHPMYAGGLLVILGWAVWRGSLLHFGVAVMLALFYDRKARYEEGLLAQRYPDYESYRRHTRRLIPWVY